MAMKKTVANHFELLESDDPGDMHVEQQKAAPPSLTEQLFGQAYPSAWEIIRNRQERPYGGGAPANTKAPADSKKGVQGSRGNTKAPADSKKGTQGSQARKQGGRHVDSPAVNDEAPAPRLYDLAQFPSLK